MFSPETPEPNSDPSRRADQILRGVMEAIVLGLVVAAPWPFGSVASLARFAIQAALGLLVVAWAIRVVLRGRIEWSACPLAACLAGFVGLSVLQLIALPESALEAVSPATLERYRFYLPDEPELLASEADVPRPGAHPLTLYPHATRSFLAGALTLFLLYAVVRNNLATPATFRRLAWACLINGALLSVLALAQSVSSAPGTVFWGIETAGAVFGPFVDRNHFPFFVNVCCGLGIALLAGTGASRARGLLQNPRALWALAGVGVMLAAVAASRSRGGLLALAVAASVCAAFWLRGRPRLGPAVYAVPLAAVVAAWFGLSTVQERLASGADALGPEGRLEIWTESLREAGRFPVFGVGNGTFATVETSFRRDPAAAEWLFEHAHNEYVEALVEGGLIRFGLTSALVWLALAGAARAWRRTAGRSAGALALGALFALTTLAVHSAVDFGIHIPAVAVLATVVAAQVRGLADADAPPRSFSGPAAGCWAVAVSAVAGLLAWQGWCADQAVRYRYAAALTPPEKTGRRIEYLEAAVRLDPSEARTHHDLGVAYLDAARPADGAPVAPTALRHWRTARDLSPMSPEPQVRLGLFRDRFQRANPAIRYFERALRSRPADPDLWYACGRLHFDAGEREAAWREWRQALALSDRRLGEILRSVAGVLDAPAMLERLLPEKPDVIRAAADGLYPAGSPDAAGRALLLERALALLTSNAGRTAAERRMEAQLDLELGRLEEGFAAYRAALAAEPGQVGWRLEYARALQEQERFEEATKELRTVLGQQPENRAARDLLDVINREVRLRESRQP